jgi:serine/threonine protein kinase/SAM-dependent methyltransferase
MDKEKMARAEALAKAIGRWTDREGDMYRDAFVLGTGGEGTTVVAERIPRKRPDRDPATSHVVIKLPVVVVRNSDNGLILELQSDDTRMNRLRAEHKKRETLGNAPHMSQTPDLLELGPADLEGVPIRYREIDRTSLKEKDKELKKSMPILRTPLSRPRGGAIVPVSLQRVTPEHGCWSSRELLNWTIIVRAVGRALWSIHGRDWAHGDIKPENVVLYESRSRWHDVQLIDFGLVHPSFPGTLQEAGSLYYFRPERLETMALHKYPPGLTPATEDLYALGVMLVEVLLGSRVTDGLRRVAEDMEKKEKEERSKREKEQQEKGIEPEERQKKKWFDDRYRFYPALLRERLRYELRQDAYLFEKGPAGHPSQNGYRVAACRLCDRLLAWPDADRSTIDVLRDLLAAVDIRLVGVGDPETMFTKLLVGLGAKQPGDQIRATRKKYRSLDPDEPPAARPAGEGPAEVEAFIEQAVEAAVEWLRRGRGAMAERHLVALFEWAASRPPEQPWLPGEKSAYDLCQALRLYCGILLVRERMLGRARELLARFDGFQRKWTHAHAGGKLVQWWVTHIGQRLTLLECLHSGQGDLSSLERQARELRTERPARAGEAMRAWDAADRWAQSLLCDIELARKPENEPDIAIEPLKKVQDKRESSHEAAYGAIQLMRAHSRLAQRQLDAIPGLIQVISTFEHPDLHRAHDPSEELIRALIDFLSRNQSIFDIVKKLHDLPPLLERFPGLRQRFPGLVELFSALRPAPGEGETPMGIVDSLWEAVYKFLLAVGWTIAGPMPHENALVLRHAAAIIYELFTSLEKITDHIRALLVSESSPLPGLDEQLSPYLWMFLIPKAHISTDVEAGLLGAASAALAAADAYRDLHVMPSAVKSFELAGKCYLRCTSAEHVLDGISWLSFAKNDLLLWKAAGGEALEAEQRRDPFDLDAMLKGLTKAIARGNAAWVEAASRAYAGTAGGDPASFVGRLFFGRHGVEIARLTEETLAVELVAAAPDADPGSPPRSTPVKGAVLERMLLKLARSLQLARSKERRTISGPFLELDCGLGANCRLAKVMRLGNLGFDAVVGLDTMEWCVQEAQRSTATEAKHQPELAGIAYHRFSMHNDGPRCEESSVLERGRYGVIWMHDTLCRVSHRAALLSSACELLLETGYLMFTDWIQVRRAAQDEWSSFCAATGLVSLETEQGYRKLLDEAGFDALLVRRFDREMKDFFSVVERSLAEDPLSNAHARGGAAILQNVQRFVADGPGGLDGFDAAPLEVPASAVSKEPSPAAPAPTRGSADPNEYHKEGFVGWLWVIARPRARPADAPRPAPPREGPPPTPVREATTGRERPEAPDREQPRTQIGIGGPDAAQRRGL